MHIDISLERTLSNCQPCGHASLYYVVPRSLIGQVVRGTCHHGHTAPRLSCCQVEGLAILPSNWLILIFPIILMSCVEGARDTLRPVHPESSCQSCHPRLQRAHFLRAEGNTRTPPPTMSIPGDRAPEVIPRMTFEAIRGPSYLQELCGATLRGASRCEDP